MLKVSVLLRAPSALLRLLRRDAHWRQTSITAAIGSAIGLVNDVFSPIAQFYALMFGVAATVFAFSFFRWRQQRKSGIAAPRQQKGRAKTAMASLIFAASILPFWILNGATRNEGGTVAALIPQVQETQNALLNELGLLRQAMEDVREAQEEQTEILEQSADEQQRQGETLDTIAQSTQRQEQSLDDIRELGERQEDSLSGIEDLMTASVALERLAQASADRDGTDIGQTEAVEALLARGRGLQGRDFSGISLRGLRADTIDLTDSQLHFTNLKDAELSRATLTGAGLTFTELGGAQLDGANLAKTESHFLRAQNVNLQGADLSGVQFIGADLRGANLAGANLRGARFVLADFEGANLDGADLKGAIILVSRMTGVTWADAEFAETMLETSFVDDGALTRRQIAGTCRHPIYDPSISTYERIHERFEDSSDSDGYRYNRFSPDAYYRSGDRPQYSVLGWPDWTFNLLRSSSPLCENPPSSDGIISVAAPLRFSLNLDRTYLGPRNRRAFVKSYFAEHYRNLLIQRENDQFFVGSMGPQDRWLDSFKKALRSTKPERGTPFSLFRQDDLLATFLREDVYEPSELARARLTGNALQTAAQGSALASVWVKPGRGQYRGIGGYSDDNPFFEPPQEAADAYQDHIVQTAPRFDRFAIDLDVRYRKRSSYQVNPETNVNEMVWTIEIENQTVRAPTQAPGVPIAASATFFNGPARQSTRGDRVGPLIAPFDQLPADVIEAMDSRGIVLSWINPRAEPGPQLFIVLDDWRGEEILSSDSRLSSEEIRTLEELSLSLDYKVGRTIHRDKDKRILVVEAKLTNGIIQSTPSGLFD